MTHQITVVPYIPEGEVTPGEPIEIRECDECGAAISDPDLHSRWHDNLLQIVVAVRSSQGY